MNETSVAMNASTALEAKQLGHAKKGIVFGLASSMIWAASGTVLGLASSYAPFNV